MEIDILYLKTFAVVAGMLVITAQASKFNRKFEKGWEMWGSFIAVLALVFIIPMFRENLPVMVALTALMAALMGWIIGPGIQGIMNDYSVRQALKEKGYDKHALKAMSDEEAHTLHQRAATDLEKDAGLRERVGSQWQAVFNMALYGTALTTVTMGMFVMLTDYDFGWLGMGLFVALIALIVVGVLNALFFKSRWLSLVGAYAGVVIFTLYLLYDFNQLEKLAASGDTSWATAVQMGISIYIDIINLFLDLLRILASD